MKRQPLRPVSRLFGSQTGYHPGNVTTELPFKHDHPVTSLACDAPAHRLVDVDGRPVRRQIGYRRGGAT